MTRLAVPILVTIFFAANGHARTTSGDIERLTDTVTGRIGATLDASLSSVIPSRLALAPVDDSSPSPPKLLSSESINAVISTDFRAMRACYTRHAKKQRKATGRVELQLSISYRGRLWALKIKAPGVSGRRYERCMRRLARKWKFPESDKDTVAHFPLRYQYTAAPGAGPTSR